MKSRTNRFEYAGVDGTGYASAEPAMLQYEPSSCFATKLEISQRLRTSVACSSRMIAKRSRPQIFPIPGSGLKVGPASETSTVAWSCHTGSTPRLSYMPPSERAIARASACASSPAYVPPERTSRMLIGENTPGRQDDDAAARAIVQSPK